MDEKPIVITMTRFGDFVVSDPLGQLAKVREVKRQYEAPYGPSGDFWSRWRDGVRNLHRMSGSRDGLDLIRAGAKDNRAQQYGSACEGYAKFWGRKTIEFVGSPKPVLWTHHRLQVKVNPEWVLRINGVDTLVKLHLKEKLALSQRVANPLLHLLDQHFGAPVGGPQVALLDVHRGRLWQKRTEIRGIEPVLRMQAAAFLAGWDQVDLDDQAA